MSVFASLSEGLHSVVSGEVEEPADADGGGELDWSLSGCFCGLCVLNPWY